MGIRLYRQRAQFARVSARQAREIAEASGRAIPALLKTSSVVPLGPLIQQTPIAARPVSPPTVPLPGITIAAAPPAADSDAVSAISETGVMSAETLAQIVSMDEAKARQQFASRRIDALLRSCGSLRTHFERNPTMWHVQDESQTGVTPQGDLVCIPAPFYEAIVGVEVEDLPQLIGGPIAEHMIYAVEYFVQLTHLAHDASLHFTLQASGCDRKAHAAGEKYVWAVLCVGFALALGWFWDDLFGPLPAPQQE
jgi:hypothetical protein